MGGGGGALVGYAGGRPPPLMGYTGCPGGPGGWGGPGCGRRNGGAAQFGVRPEGPGGAATGGPDWAGACTGGHAVPAACAATGMPIDSVRGGRPAIPWWRPTSKISCGPSGFPMLMVWPSWMSTSGTRRPLTKVPFSEPLSIASHLPWSKRSSRWAREISGCVMRMSARRSRPTTTS